MRRLAALAAAALRPVLAGCGGGGSAPTASSGDGAELAPADAAAFVAIDSNPDSEQWKTVERLARKFPGADDLVGSVTRDLREKSGLDYEDDVRPALGDEVDVVWLDFAN